MSSADSLGTASSGGIGRFEAVGWGVAGLVALSLHAGILWATQHADESEGHADLPEAVMIELAPPSAAQEPFEEAAEVPEADLAPAEPVPEPIREEIAEVPEPVAQPEPELTPQPEPVEEEITEAPEPEPVFQPEEEASAPAETAAPAEPEVTDLVTPAENIPLPMPRPTLKPTIRPEPVKRTAEKPAQAVKPVRKKEAQKAPPAARSASARAEQARPKPSAAAAPSQRRQAPSVSPARWQSKLVAYLNRHKRYPRTARSRKEEGTAQLAFTIDASGKVLSARIARSSGSPELDGEVLAMIRRASPLPAPPEAIARSRMDLSVPISFKLR